MTGLHKRLPQTRQGWVVSAFITIALVLGGGGSPSAAAEVLVQLGFAACVVAWFLWAGPAFRSPREAAWLAVLVVAVPVVQLIPLPPGLWSALPGRGMVTASLDLAAGERGWRPSTISPPLTLASLLSMIPVAGCILAVATLGKDDRRAILLLVALVAIAGACLGVVQMASGHGAFRLYQVSHDLWLTAFHASRNSAADALLIGSLALTAWMASGTRKRPLFRGDLVLLLILQSLLVVAVILTGSRAGISLLPPVLLLEFAMLRSVGIARQFSRGLAATGMLLALLGAAAVTFSGNARIATVLERFDATRDFRSELWRDTLTAIGEFWPVGSGMGTFTRAFLPFERAEVLDDLFPNRAHNDFLEFALEAGLFGSIALLGVIVLLATLARRAWSARPIERPETLFAGGTLMVIGLHSLVDYPLRNMALASLAGVAAGLLVALSRAPAQSRRLDVQE